MMESFNYMKSPICWHWMLFVRSAIHCSRTTKWRCIMQCKRDPVRSALIDPCIRITVNVFFILTMYNASNQRYQLKLGANSPEEAAIICSQEITRHCHKGENEVDYNEIEDREDNGDNDESDASDDSGASRVRGAKEEVARHEVDAKAPTQPYKKQPQFKPIGTEESSVSAYNISRSAFTSAFGGKASKGGVTKRSGTLKNQIFEEKTKTCGFFAIRESFEHGVIVLCWATNNMLF